jgi:hypothetical protein
MRDPIPIGGVLESEQFGTRIGPTFLRSQDVSANPQTLL